MPPLTPEDLIFEEINHLKPKLSKTNQELVPTLVNLFVEFKTKFFEDMQSKFDSMVSQMKQECTNICKSKDLKIVALENTCKTLSERVGRLEERIDDEDAYIRRDSLIFSGDAIQAADNTNCTTSLIALFRSKLNITVNPTDISVSHRLGKNSVNQGPDRRNIVAKFCRRDLKRDILAAARRMKPANFYANESLTTVRQKINRALRNAKKDHANVISGLTSIDGRIFIWRKNPDGPRDVRHCINTLEKLEEFCQRNLGVSSTNFLV